MIWVATGRLTTVPGPDGDLKGKLQSGPSHKHQHCGAGWVGEKLSLEQRGVVELQSVKKCPLLLQLSFQAGLWELGTRGLCESKIPSWTAHCPSPPYTLPFTNGSHPDPIPFQAPHGALQTSFLELTCQA